MEQRKKYRTRSLCLMLILCLCLTLCGCESKLKYRPIEDIEQLDDHRIGVCLAWAADYLLSDREDMRLMRYNSHADLITALYYRRLDAIAVERTVGNYIMTCVDGLRIIEPAVANHQYILYVNNARPEVVEEFNAFIAEFRNTDVYTDLVQRANAPGVYDYHPVELAGGDKTLTIAVADSEYPFSYLDFNTGEAIGSDIELISHFANACGYSLNIVPSEYNNIIMRVMYGQADVAISAVSELWTESMQALDSFLITDPYMTGEVVFMDVVDPDALKILSTLDY